MGNVLQGIIPANLRDNCDHFQIINCGEQASSSESSSDIEVLYPTSDDVDFISGSAIPMPVQGGAIIKKPGPTGVITDGSNSKTMKRVEALTGFFSELEEELSSMPDDILEQSELSESVDLERYITNAKLAANKGFFRVAGRGNTSSIENVYRMYLAKSNRPDLEDSGTSVHSRRFVEFVYVPIEVLVYVAKKFGEKFGETRASCGQSFENMNTAFDGLKGINALALNESDADSESEDESLADVLGLDVLALILSYLGIFNSHENPIDAVTLACEITEGQTGTNPCAEAEALASLVDTGIQTPDFTPEQAIESVLAIEDDLSDAFIRDIMLEFLPIFNISEKNITGKSKIQNVAFFTIWNDTAYLKMPDLSGMNSGGFADEIYKDDDEFFRHLYFETVSNGEIARKGFSFQPIPSISINEYEPAFPDANGSDDFILSLEGEVDNIQAVYLSATVPISGSVSKAKGFNDLVSDAEGGIEFFTAPLLTKPIINNSNRKSKYEDELEKYLDSDGDDIAVPGIISELSSASEISNTFGRNSDNDTQETLSFEGQDDGSGNLLGNLADVASSVAEIGESVSGADAELERLRADPDSTPEEIAAAEAAASSTSSALSGASEIMDGIGEAVTASGALKDISKLEIGFPLYNQSFRCFDSLPHILGEKNRPEIYCSDMDGDPSSRLENFLGQGNRKNDRHFHKQRFYGSSRLMLSNRPKLCGSQHIPALWIKSDDFEETDGGIDVKFTPDQFKYIKRKEISFAVYAIDSLGQIFRVPDQYVNFESEPPDLSSVTPNGCGLNVIDADEELNLIFEGSNLHSVDKIVATSDSGEVVEFFDGDDAGTDINITSSEMLRLTTSRASGMDLTYDTFYTVKAVSSTNGNESDNPLKIVCVLDQDVGPDCPDPEVVLGPKKVRPIKFLRTNVIEGLPILQDGTSAEVKIRAKSSIFNPNSVIYAYLAFDKDEENISDILDDFSMEDTRYSATITNFKKEEKEVIIPFNIEYEFNYGSGDFSRDPLSFIFPKKKAILKFPGQNYKDYNFSSLINVKKCYIVLLSDGKITDLGLDSDGYLPIPEKRHSCVQIGDDTSGKEKAAFTTRPYILGMLSQSSDKYLQTLGRIGDIEAERIDAAFGEGTSSEFEHSSISTQNSFGKLMIVFRGIKHKVFARRQFKFFMGSDNLNKKIEGIIRSWPGNNRSDEFQVVFNDIIPTEQNKLLPVYVKNKDPKFNVEYTGEILYKEATINDVTLGGSASSTSSSGNIVVSTDSSGGESVSLVLTDFCEDPACNMGWVGPKPPSAKIGTVMFSELGFPINKSGEEYLKDPKEVYEFLGINKFSSSVDLSLNLDGSDASISDGSDTEGTSLALDSITVSDSAEFKDGAFFTNTFPVSDNAEKARGSVRVSIQDHCSVAVGLAYLRAIVLASGEIIYNTDNHSSRFVRAIGSTSEIVKLLVETSVPDGIQVVVNDAEVRWSRARVVSEELVELTLIPPSGDDKNATNYVRAITENNECVVVCVTAQNSQYVRAREELGENVVDNPLGKIRFRSGTRTFDLMENPRPVVPKLSLPGGIPLEFPSIPPALIKDICDFSFHLTADLQLSLGNFQVLMIPLQCIFMIIDVLCAILNPWKMALALIRLFECLFDLIALIPQISVPIMFLNLCLHLLEIIQCILEKILFVIKAINVIIPAFEAAFAKPFDWNAILHLEKVLSEYILDVAADLEFLSPFSTILGIFLQLLQTTFRVPCQINSSATSGYICGLDGTLLAGLIVGKAVPAEGSIDVNYLVPVAQAYSTVDTDGFGNMWNPDDGPACLGLVSDDTSTPYLPSSGDGISDLPIFEVDEAMVVESRFDIDDDSYRGSESGSPGDITFSVSCTKSKRNGGDMKKVKFLFNSRAEPICIGPFIPITKRIDADSPADYPFFLFDGDKATSAAPKLEVSGSGSTFVSPYDGYNFLNSSGKVKDLEVTFTWTEMSLDEETGEVIETEVSRTKTFDGVPSLVILDNQGDVYFIEEIHRDSDGAIERIDAKVINQDTANHLKFLKEAEEILLPGGDGVTYEEKYDEVYQEKIDDGASEEDAATAAENDTGVEDAGKDDVNAEIKVFTFPQIYFFDMRQLENELEEMCTGPNIVDAILEDAADDDFEPEVQAAKDCIDLFIENTRAQLDLLLESLKNGEIPGFIDMNEFGINAQDMIDCLEKAVDNTCKYVVSPLTTSFKVEEDDDDTDVEGFVEPDGIDTEILEDFLDDFEHHGPDMTGAKEFASGDGDSADLMVGEVANIVITPRDVHDTEVLADFTDKIIVTIVSDSTGTASLKQYVDDDGNPVYVQRDGDSYRTELTASSPGVVRVKASICGKTIQALTYASISENIYEEVGGEASLEVDCFPDAESGTSTSDEDVTSDNFNLARVDRILTITFNKAFAASLSAEDSALTPRTSPQVFGTKLEN